MKTITLANSHVAMLRVALRNQIEKMEEYLRDEAPESKDFMFWRDQLDIARQALDIVEG